jgi:hypothetical protein
VTLLNFKFGIAEPLKELGGSGVAEGLTGAKAKQNWWDYLGKNAVRNHCPFLCPNCCRLRPNDAILPY